MARKNLDSSGRFVRRSPLLAVALLLGVAVGCEDPMTPDPSIDVEPSFAKGTHWPGKIVFESDQDGSYDVFIMNADGSGATNLTQTSSVHESDPELSPDGTRIAYARGGQVWTMYASGRGQRMVAVGFDPAWSPDGTQLVFTRFVGTHPNRHQDLYVANADGTGVVPRVSAPGPQIMPSWAPRDSITYVSEGYLTGYGITGQRAGQEPEWSPDGTKLAYHTTQSWGAGGHDNDQIYIYDTADETTLRVTFTSEGWDDRDPTWSPDGERIAFVRGNGWNVEEIRWMDRFYLVHPGALASGNNPSWGPCPPSRNWPPC